MAIPLLIAGAFEAAVIATDAIALAGMDALAAQAIRAAAVAIARQFGRAMATDALLTGSAATAASGAMIMGGQLTEVGVTRVIKALAALMKDAPHLESEFRALRQMGMHFFPALANGQVVVVCRMTARTGARRVVYLLFSPRTTREQLQEFFKRCRIAQTAPANANPLLWNPFKLRRANDPL